MKAGFVRYVNAHGKESVIPEAEAARRKAIGAFARERFRTGGGVFEVRRFRVEVAGWTTRSREGKREERHAGWDYHDAKTFIVESSLADEDYLRNLLEERFPERRFWDVTNVEEVEDR